MGNTKSYFVMTKSLRKIVDSYRCTFLYYFVTLPYLIYLTYFVMTKIVEKSLRKIIHSNRWRWLSCYSSLHEFLYFFSSVRKRCARVMEKFSTMG